MANVKISALPSATSIAGADVIPIVQSGVTKKITKAIDHVYTEDYIDNLFGEGEATPSYINSFVAAVPPLKILGSGYDTRCIQFQGMVDVSLVTFTPGTFIQMFTLGASLRPKKVMYFPVIGLYDAIGVVSVHTDGKVYMKNLYGDLLDSGIVDMSNISYYVTP